MRESFISAIEELTGHPVISFASGIHVHSEMNTEVFRLAPAPD